MDWRPIKSNSRGKIEGDNNEIIICLGSRPDIDLQKLIEKFGQLSQHRQFFFLLLHELDIF